MFARRYLLPALTLLSLAMFAQAASKPAPADMQRLQGELFKRDDTIMLRPCGSQRLLTIRDAANTAIIDEAKQLGIDDRSLFADVDIITAGSTARGADGQADVVFLYRLQAEGHACNDPDFKKLTLRASGNEPGWQVEVSSQGMKLQRMGKEPVALPYLEEQLPEGRFSLSSEGNNQRLDLWIAPQYCVDDMSGTVSHLKAELRIDQDVYRGCAYYGAARSR